MKSEENLPLPKKRRARWFWRVLRWIGILVAGLVALVALWLAAENVMGRIALGRWDREMRARGEKPTLADLKLPPAGPKEERRCALIEAVEALMPFKDSCKLASGGLSAPRSLAPGKRAILARQPAPIDPVTLRDDKAALKEPHEWADLSAQVDRARAPLEALRAAASEGRWDANEDYTKGAAILLPHLSPARNAARWLSSAAIRDLHEGHRAAAVRNVVVIANLGRAMWEEPMLIGQLVRIAVDSLGMSTTWEALQIDGWGDAQLLQLQQAWQQAGVLGELPRTFEMERVLGRITFAQLRGGRVGGDLFDYVFGEDQRPLRRMLCWASERGYVWGLSWNDELFYCRLMQTNIKAARLGAREGAWIAVQAPMDAIERRMADAPRLERLRHPLSNLLEPALSHMMLSFFRHETQREMTVAAIALEHFKLRHGSYPARLDDLVTEFVVAVPRDFMDGKPLRYRKNADGTFTLWSVGENLVDDGGDPTPTGKADRLNWWECKDFVWPRPATAEEIAAAVAKEKR